MLDVIKKSPKVLIQGITGEEGTRAAEYMLSSGTDVGAGVRPGKAGEKVKGIPVYDSVKDALKQHPDINIACIYVPPQFVLDAAKESMEAGIKFIHIMAEGVPVKDTATLLEEAREKDISILGPSSLGFLIPGKIKIGSIGGDDNSSFSAGSVGVISRSGGMCSELSALLTRSGIGQSIVIHIGGDYLIGLTPADLIQYFENDDSTKVMLLIGEVGGQYELDFAREIADKRLTKPVVAFIGGLFTETLPRNVPLGHAGAIIGGKEETTLGKSAALKKAGVKVAKTPYEVRDLIKDIL